MSLDKEDSGRTEDNEAVEEDGTIPAMEAFNPATASPAAGGKVAPKPMVGRSTPMVAAVKPKPMVARAGGPSAARPGPAPLVKPAPAAPVAAAPPGQVYASSSGGYGSAAAPYAQAPAPYAQAPAPYAQAPAPYAQAPAPYAQAPAPYAQAPAPYAQAPAPYAQAPAPYAQAPAPYAQAPAPYAQVPAPYAQPPASPPAYSGPPGYAPPPGYDAAPGYAPGYPPPGYGPPPGYPGAPQAPQPELYAANPYASASGNPYGPPASAMPPGYGSTQLPAPPGMGMPPPKSAPRSRDVSSSISYTIDVLMAALHTPNKKRKRWAVLIGIIVVVVIGLGVIIGGPRISSKLGDGDGKGEGEVGAPTWVELELFEILVRTQPAGASVVINGVLQDKTSPTLFKMVKGHTNTVGVFLSGHLPAWRVVAADVQPAGGIELEMSAATDIELGLVKITASVPEDAAGSEVWFDGKLVGTLPVLLEQIPLGVYHHVFVTSPRKAPFVAVFRPREAQNELQVPMMGTGVYLDRNSDFEIVVEQKQARSLVTVGKDQFSVPGHATFEKGQMIDVKLEMNERESFHQTFHTSAVGSIRVQPWLDWADVGKAQVQFLSPPKRELYACLKRPGRAICWNNKASDLREVPAGTWTVQAFELDRGKRAFAKGSAELLLGENQLHKVQLSLTPELELGATIKESTPWNPGSTAP